VEKRFLADNEFFEEVLSAEDALIDQYLLGQLSDEQRRRAQALFQSSTGQKREVKFTKELIASVRDANPKNNQTSSAPKQIPSTEAANKTQPEEALSDNSKIESPATWFWLNLPGLKNLAPRFATIGGLVILLVCLSLIIWIFYLYSQKRGWEAQRIAVERSSQEALEMLSKEKLEKAELQRQLEIEKEIRAQAEEQAEELIAQALPRRPERITSILLTPATLERGGNSKTVSLKAETGRVQFQLELDENYRHSRYSVVLTTFDGRRVWSKDALDAGQTRGGRLTLTLPSSLLEYEDYRIELKGLTDNGDFVHVADYIFKVRK
jgi:hypothetical protein